MSNSNKSNWGTYILIGSILMGVGWVCNYLGEQTSRMDPLAQWLLGAMLVGSIFMWLISQNK